MARGGTAPWHLWAVGVAALLFNAIGLFDFVMSMARGADYMASAGMSPAQIAIYWEMPPWMTIVWGIGVVGAFLASALLLARRKAAVAIFIVSLAAFLINLLYLYGVADGGRVLGRQMAWTSGLIAALLALLTWYARAMARRGVLR